MTNREENGAKRRGATMLDLLAVVEPGETVSYSDVIERLKEAELPTSGIGIVVKEIAFRGYSGAWRGGEIVSYRTPYFDREAEGDWTDGTLFVVRRDSEADDDA